MISSSCKKATKKRLVVFPTVIRMEFYRIGKHIHEWSKKKMKWKTCKYGRWGADPPQYVCNNLRKLSVEFHFAKHMCRCCCRRCRFISIYFCIPPYFKILVLFYAVCNSVFLNIIWFYICVDWPTTCRNSLEQYS